MYSVGVPNDEELTFADHAGRLYARRYSFPPMAARLLGYLAVCDPRDPTIGELAEALLASRSAIAGAVGYLENLGLVRRARTAGERMDRVSIDLMSRRALGFDVSEYQEQLELAHEGLQLLADATVERRAVLLEWAALAEFLIEQMPIWEAQWRERRDRLVADGKLPDLPSAHREARER